VYPHAVSFWFSIKLQNLQYVGGGYGSRDLVYLFCSAFDSTLVDDDNWKQLLTQYHTELVALLPPAAASAFTYDTLQAQFELCMADYTRFMAGWGKTHIYRNVTSIYSKYIYCYIAYYSIVYVKCNSVYIVRCMLSYR
jgi:hypothetical protein